MDLTPADREELDFNLAVLEGRDEGGLRRIGGTLNVSSYLRTQAAGARFRQNFKLAAAYGCAALALDRDPTDHLDAAAWLRTALVDFTPVELCAMRDALLNQPVPQGAAQAVHYALIAKLEDVTTDAEPCPYHARDCA